MNLEQLQHNANRYQKLAAQAAIKEEQAEAWAKQTRQRADRAKSAAQAKADAAITYAQALIDRAQIKADIAKTTAQAQIDRAQTKADQAIAKAEAWATQAQEAYEAAEFEAERLNKIWLDFQMEYDRQIAAIRSRSKQSMQNT